MKQPRDMMSTAEVAAGFGVHHDTVRRWIANGKLEGVRVGKLFFVRRASYERLVHGLVNIATEHGAEIATEIGGGARSMTMDVAPGPTMAGEIRRGGR